MPVELNLVPSDNLLKDLQGPCSIKYIKEKEPALSTSLKEDVMGILENGKPLEVQCIEIIRYFKDNQYSTQMIDFLRGEGMSHALNANADFNGHED
jgi:hypothetical protein